MNEIDIITAEAFVVCDQCGAIVLKQLQGVHGRAHSTFGSFSDIPTDVLVTYASPEDLKGFTQDEGDNDE